VRLLSVLVFSSALLTGCGGPQAAPEAASVDADVPASAGEKLFAVQCTQCHRLNEVNVGPALRGSLAHWGGDTARYKSFIRNSQAVIESGDAYAVKIFNDWGKTVMPAQNLTEAELDALVSYLNP
jgi:mono/diheme cytochrome c family protein